MKNNKTGDTRFCPNSCDMFHPVCLSQHPEIKGNTRHIYHIVSSQIQSAGTQNQNISHLQTELYNIPGIEFNGDL